MGATNDGGCPLAVMAGWATGAQVRRSGFQDPLGGPLGHTPGALLALRTHVSPAGYT